MLQQIQKNNRQTHAYSADTENMGDFLKIIFDECQYSLVELENQTIDLKEHFDSFFMRLEKEEHPSKKKPYPISYSLNRQSGLLLYAICKIMRPDKVVETGVAYGLSSSYILKALTENNKGTLYSIDSTFRPWETKQMIGSAIPEDFRKRWNFIFGTSSEKLSTLLKSLQTTDIFIHDSLHTYNNMMFEFTTAWPHIRKNGLLLSDDIIDNNAFYDFYSSLKIKPSIMKHDNQSLFGALQKLD